MGLKEQIKKLEIQAVQMSERDLCPHLPPVIYWADGSIENDAPHDCGKPRLIISVGYSDGSDQRVQQGALDTFDGVRRECPDVAAEDAAQIIASRYPLTPETRAELFERAGGVCPNQRSD
jgi:hypothetical protein